MSTAEQVVCARRAKGWSQEELAQEAGLSLRTIQRIEKGTVQARLHSLRVLGETLEIDLVKLNNQPNNTSLTDDHWRRLRQLNFSAFLGLLLPLFNLIVPIWLWRRFIATSQADGIARRMISAQLLWTVVVFLFLLASPAISYQLTGQVSVGRIPLFVWIYLLAALSQIGLIFLMASRITQRDHNRLLTWPNFF